MKRIIIITICLLAALVVLGQGRNIEADNMDEKVFTEKTMYSIRALKGLEPADDRAFCVNSLAMTETKGILPLMLDLLESDEDSNVREAIARNLEKFATEKEKTMVIGALRKIVNKTIEKKDQLKTNYKPIQGINYRATVQHSALLTLSRLEDEGSVMTMISWIKDKDVDVFSNSSDKFRNRAKEEMSSVFSKSKGEERIRIMKSLILTFGEDARVYTNEFKDGLQSKDEKVLERSRNVLNEIQERTKNRKDRADVKEMLDDLE